MCMNAVDAGKCVRYQSGGGQTANSHSTNRAVAATIPRAAWRRSRTTGSADGQRRHRNGSRARGADGLADGGDRDVHLARLVSSQPGWNAVESDVVREPPVALGLDLERLPALRSRTLLGEARVGLNG